MRLQVPRWKTLAAVAAAGAMMLTACGGSSDSADDGDGGGDVTTAEPAADDAADDAADSSAEPETEGASHRVAVLIPDTGQNPYFAGYMRGLTAAAEERGVELIMLDSQYDATVQLNQVDEAIAQDPDGFIVWAVDQQGIVPSLARLADLGKPIVASNSEVDESGVQYLDAYTGPNDVKQGGIAADLMVEAIGTEGKVILVNGLPGTAPAIRRAQGFKDRIAEIAPGIEIIAEQPGNFEKAESKLVTADMLTRHGDEVDGLFAADDTMAIGAAEAVAEAGLADQVAVVGLGGSCDGFEGVRSGAMFGTMVQSPIFDGSEAVNAVANLIEGKPQEEVVYLEIPVIRQDNVDDFECEW